MNYDVNVWKSFLNMLRRTIGRNVSGFCNEQGRKMGIYGNTDNGTKRGVDDDLDAFRHTYFSALMEMLNPLQLIPLIGQAV